MVGQFKNGPYIIEDVILDLEHDELNKYKEGIIQAIYQVNDPIKSPIKKITERQGDVSNASIVNHQ